VSGKGDFRGSLVGTVGEFGDLHGDVGEEAAGTEAEPLRGEPCGTEGFADHDEVLEGFLGGADATCGLHADHFSGGGEVVPDGFEHDEGDWEGGGGLDFSGTGFDEVGPGVDGEVAGEADIVRCLEFAGFEDDLEVGVAAGGADGGDFVEDAAVLAGEEGTAVDDHIDFVGSVGDGVADFGEACLEGGFTAGEGGGDTGDPDGGACECLEGGTDERWVDADGGDLRAAVVIVHGLAGFGAEVLDFSFGIGSFEGGEVHHGHGEAEACCLGFVLDAAAGEDADSFGEAGGVDGRRRERERWLLQAWGWLDEDGHGFVWVGLASGRAGWHVHVEVRKAASSTKSVEPPVCQRRRTTAGFHERWDWQRAKVWPAGEAGSMQATNEKGESWAKGSAISTSCHPPMPGLAARSARSVCGEASRMST